MAYLQRALWAFLLITGILLAPSAAKAHVGSPDIYADGGAGPYRLFVTVRPPLVIPGVAEIEVRVDTAAPSSAAVTGIEMAPIPLTGEASKHPPVADAMKQSPQDKQFYTGALWIMASGSWQVRFTVHGNQGDGVLSIPVPASASSTRGMQTGLGVLLSTLGLLLVVGVVGIVGAAVRDARLAPGAIPSSSSRKRARAAMVAALLLTIAAVAFGNVWWKNEAGSYARYVYKPLVMQSSVGPNHMLRLKIEDPGWIKSRKIDDFVPDHDHLMHLYMIRQPGMDVVYHLHPDQVAPGEFQLELPSVPAGDYRLYADVVHATGFPETPVASITLPDIAGRPLSGDDAKGTAQPLSVSAAASACSAAPASEPKFELPDGYAMVWRNSTPQPAKTPQIFEFSLLDRSGKPASDTSLYMGMLGHAAFVKADGSVFAHVHPSGTVSMAALMMAAAQNPQVLPAGDAMSSMPGMAMPNSPSAHPAGDPPASTAGRLPNSVGFPYGFPAPGGYRIFVQMKHGSTIETAAFDACASPARIP